MALHFEDACETIADVDDAGVFAGTLNDPGGLGGKAAKMDARGFIGTMLIPHGRENTEFGETRRAADESKDPLILVRREAMRGDEFGDNFGFEIGG